MWYNERNDEKGESMTKREMLFCYASLQKYTIELELVLGIKDKWEAASWRSDVKTEDIDSLEKIFDGLLTQNKQIGFI